jgi:hypothetical protein
MKFYTVDKFAIVILPSGMTEKAKTSKSLFNSFNRIYRFATIGAVSVAALFSAQFIQQNNRIAIDNTRANTGNQFLANSPPESTLTESDPEMTMKSAAPAGPTISPESSETGPSSEEIPMQDQSQYTGTPESMPVDGDSLSQMTPTVPIIGDGWTDLYISIIIGLSVGIIGLIIERILSSRRKKTRNYQTS